MNISFRVSVLGKPESKNIEGTLADLISFFPSLCLIASKAKYFPPLNVLNRLFMAGEFDEGMSGGCHWKPFQIDNENYEQLVKEVEKHFEVEFLIDAQMQKANNYKEWTKLVFRKCKGKHRNIAKSTS